MRIISVLFLGILLLGCTGENKPSESENIETTISNQETVITSSSYDYYFEQEGTVLTGSIYSSLIDGAQGWQGWSEESEEDPEIDDDSEKEYIYILKLENNISVGTLPDDDFSEATTDNEVQFFSIEEQVLQYIQENVNNNITVKGTLFFHHTSHHRRPIMFNVSEIIE
jgi:hypothetical protein